MLHPFAGLGGLSTGAVVFLLVGTLSYRSKKHSAYNLDPLGKSGAFEPLLAKYLRLAEYVIGLAAGSIVLLVGSSALHGQGGRLPWFYASPLILLAWCVVYGVGFMVALILNYEEYQHGNPHTRLAYSVNETFGFSSLLCFALGYVWLIIRVTR
jgi:hypothetical protein